MSSSLRRSTCNDTPQVTVGSHACTLVASHLSPLLDVPEPVVTRPSSWSSALYSAFQRSCQNVVLSFDVTIIGAFSLLDVRQELPFCVKLGKYSIVCDSVFASDLPYSH